MNPPSHHPNPSDFLHKLPRPYPLIPFRDPLQISPESTINSSQNTHISPLLFTPKIRVKNHAKIAGIAMNSSMKKTANLPNLVKKQEENSHGNSEDRKFHFFYKKASFF